ncbi:uncharacterized protein LOC127585776 [Pristis pectinata]|uniref:uncharacterized protein LOC127585776 n=1 Tax=Pristis pectinata TaxID=685728 RepID=UPI00223D6787|nr:uncharacterized protein LOC127585776 [Pristis pectinata]XP_051899421.1 uncharacterized protein LOC127585776 [Pristis pectinata]XP_051899422.1 uncharacterized protein LOC127585776 [Pristis pectinata]XP_051899423.1 uncharacterized protein LOC127585776 [Pristis pectinata]
MCRTEAIYSLFLMALVWILSKASTMEEETELNATPGGYAWFPGVDEDQRSWVEVFQWKKASGNVVNRVQMEPVLQFHKGVTVPALIQNYSRRITFSPFNGSFALHNLTHGDEGLYWLFINLQRLAVRMVSLKVTDMLSGLSLWSNSSSPGAAIQLTCNVSGDPHRYQWRKDGGEIYRHHQLTNGNKNLIIIRASSVDCGTYTCVASNPVSSMQANYTLTIYGIPPEQIQVVMLWTTGLLFSGLSIIGSIALHALQHASKQESQGKLFHFLLWLSGWNISSLVLQIALIFWSITEGVVTATTVVLYTVPALLWITFILMDVLKLSHPCVKNFLEKIGFQIVLEFSRIIVITISIIILKEKFRQMNQGCHSHAQTWGTFFILTVGFAMIYSVYTLICHCRHKSHAESSPLNKEQLHGELHESETLGPSHKAEPKSPQLV